MYPQLKASGARTTSYSGGSDIKVGRRIRKKEYICI